MSPSDTHVHVHVHQVDTDRILRAIGELASGHAQLLAQGAQILMVTSEQAALLEQINNFTNDLAGVLNGQGAALTEIGTDIDALIAATADPNLTATLTAIRDRVAGTVTTAQSTSQALTELAAKHDAPIPPPPLAPEGGQS